MKKWKCTVCGQIFEGENPPVPCPVCGAGEEAFELLEESGPALWKCTVCGQVFDGVAPPVPCPVCGAGESAFERVEAEETTFSNDTADKFVIIGGGVAALEAAKALRKRNATAEITMVMSEKHLPYNRPALTDVVGDGLTLCNLILEEKEFYAELNVRLLQGVTAKSVDTENKVVVIENGEKIPYTKILLAVGSYPFNPIKQDADSVPVHVLRTYEDAEKLVDDAKGKRVVVVGGGILGLEQAVALRERGSIITVVEHAPRILSLQADGEASARLTHCLEMIGIRIITGMSVASTGAHGITLSDGSQMAADVVLASMGVRSETTLACQLGLEVNRGIVVDEFMHTSHPDVWAAGDCAEFTGRVQALVGAAASMGATAGASMTGDETAHYKPFVPATAFECPGYSLFSVGMIADGAAETVLYQNNYSKNYKRLFFNRNVLAGALFVGENAGAKAVKAVETGAPLSRALELLG